MTTEHFQQDSLIYSIIITLREEEEEEEEEEVEEKRGKRTTRRKWTAKERSWPYKATLASRLVITIIVHGIEQAVS